MLYQVSHWLHFKCLPKSNYAPAPGEKKKEKEENELELGPVKLSKVK